ncbi:energy-coupling factor transporter transmembrane component T [Aeromicrobium sp. CTD01-1L150]|uniref:energy-coupling factor transporter transmembrane component T n=1 Tax=Aeromicrobium sp. CTD01-1L150 TaxID=3341830 RepID=UPI0035C0A6D2
MRLDPRTKALLVITTSVTVMAPGGDVFVPGAIALGAVLAASVRAWRRTAVILTATVVLAAVTYLVPEQFPHPATATIAIIASYALRLAAIGAVAAHLLATTNTAEWSAALTAARVPRTITVPSTVMLRFIPVVASEAAGVSDAMRLRGIGGWRGLLRRPVATVEWFTVPLIASSLRIGDDLSAAALLRGLGGHRRPTCMSPPRFGPSDALAVTMLFGAGFASWGLAR